MDPGTANVMAQWFDVCHRARVGLVAAQQMGQQVLDAYSEPHRHYHTLDHVHACLRQADEIPLGDDERIVVELTLWFHDVVYDPTRSDNEARSGAMARAWLDAEVDDTGELGRRVEALILMTAGHRLAGDADRVAEIVHDVDLAILGAHPDVYDEYTRQIRAEYVHLDDEAFRAGRRRVLAGFLATDDLYVLPSYRAEHGPMARSNMTRELDRLTA